MATKKPTDDESLVTNFGSIVVEYPTLSLCCLATLGTGDILIVVLLLLFGLFVACIGPSVSVQIQWGLQWK